MSAAGQSRPIERRLAGIPLSPGVAIGRPCFYVPHQDIPDSAPSPIAVDEVTRLCDSIERISHQRSALADETAAVLGQEHAEIFIAHRLMLNDAALQERFVHAIEARGYSAAEAVWHVLEEFKSQLSVSDSAYLQARADDVAEIQQALLGDLNRALACRHCRETTDCSTDHCRLGNDHILIGRDISASLPIETDSHTTGFVVDGTGPNCHAVILARALRRPMVGNIRDLPDSIPAQSQVLVDGDRGEVILNPSSETLKDYRATRLGRGPTIRRSVPVAGFRVMANISLSADVDHALAAGAEGIGLYRTEMEMLAVGRPLGEDEQAVRYSKVIKAMADRPVHIRLLDLHDRAAGEPRGAPPPTAAAPGQDCEHVLLARPALLRTQARALARASTLGPIRVVYPMISTVEQFLLLRRLFDEAATGLPIGELQHGVMFEVPSACLDATRVLQAADFGCIGTNDLIQYLFGMDRTVGDAASYRGVENQAVLWALMKQLVHAAAAVGKPMTICGELAGDPDVTCKLLECGITAISTNPTNIAAVRRSIRHRGN